MFFSLEHHNAYKKIGTTIFINFLCLISIIGQATNIGTPFITNYLNETYQAGTQNWDIQQHPNGFMFFANNNGLLQFDGINWTIFPLANKTIARSLYITHDERIYVGGQGEFGYFEPDASGLLIFHSLVGLIPKEHSNFADVWDIVAVEEVLYFNASNKVFKYDGQEIIVVSEGIIDFLGVANQQILVRNENGLHEIIQDQLVLLNGGEKFDKYVINHVAKVDEETLLVSTLHNGLLVFKNEQIKQYTEGGLPFFIENKIHCSEDVGDGQIAVGTANGGLAIVGTNGEFSYLLDRTNGLQNNHVLSVYKDNGNNLWVGLNNGIDYIAINSPFTKLMPDKDQEGTAYAGKIFQESLYLGTSKGLYIRPWKNYYNPLEDNNFERLKGTEGQVWGLDLVEEDLFMGHHNLGLIINEQEQIISTTLGNWKLVPLVNYPNHYLLGTYEGLVLYRKDGKNWKRIRQYDGLKESCRIIEQDKSGNIWIAHPYRGIYKVQIKEDLSTISAQLYGQEDGLPSNNLNHVFEINKEIIFTGETGVFKYDAIMDRFIPYQELANLIGAKERVQRFFEDPNGNIWFATNNETGVLKIADKGITKSFSKVVYPQLKNKLVRGFEFIYPYDEHNVFIGAEKGFIHFDPSKKISDLTTDFTVKIVKVATTNQRDSVFIYGQYNEHQDQLDSTLSYANNALRFSFASTNFETQKDLQFATKLEGFDDNWSMWSNKSEKDFTNLNSGDYRFLVKSKSMSGEESKTASFSFSIAPPWYASALAFAVYSFLGFLFLTGLILVPRRQFQAEKAQLESAKKRQEVEHLKIVAQSEQKIMALKNQQLEIKIGHKNRELAMSTMHLVQSSELIQQLKDTITKVAKNTNDLEAAKELKKVNRLLNESNQLSEGWDQFAHHFDQVHIDFLQKVREKYPQLTANDEKLCAYLRMNLSTKEMAPLMNISIRGVEVARYRLRKKLNLEGNINLNEFMLKF